MGRDVRVHALRNVSIEVKKGEFIMITGRNGSGKSTLLHQLGLLDIPNEGEVVIDGQKTRHMKERQRSLFRLKKIGYIFQEYALLAELTALDNVILPSMMINDYKTAKKTAIKILKKLGIGDKIHRLPNQLSGGEQQKVAIARSLVNDPIIIFADEPTANLDIKSAVDVLNIFANLNKEGHTIVMVTHEQEELKYATRLIKLSDGKVI